MKPQLCTAALCLTCKAGETLGVDSQGPGAHRLNALQERSTNWVLYPRTSSNKPRRWPNWTLNWSYPCTDPTWALLSSSALQEAPWWMKGASTTLQCLQGWESHSKWKKKQFLLTWDRGGHQSTNPAVSVLLPLVYVLQNTEEKPVVTQLTCSDHAPHLFLG